MYFTVFWCLFVVLLVFLALLRNHCYSFHRRSEGLACVAGAKRGGGGRKARKRGKGREPEGSACYKSRCFCHPPTYQLCCCFRIS